MPHFNRKTGTAVDVTAMSEEETTFVSGGRNKTIPTHEFSAQYRAGEPYEVEDGKFDRPE